MTTPASLADPCPVCKAPLANTYEVGTREGYSFHACRACGSVLTAPWPTAEELDTYYGDIQPEAVHSPNPARDIGAVGKVMAKYLPAPADGKNRLLDVNSARGYAVAAALKAGWQATGLNAHDYLHRFASSQYGENHFFAGDLAAYAAAHPGEKFDAILAVNAFTEQRDLDAFTAALAGLLAPAGVLYIEEPDGNHFNTPRDFGGWYYVDPPVTCATLSKNGLHKLLGRHGLAVKKTAFTWHPYIRAMAGHARKKA